MITKLTKYFEFLGINITRLWALIIGSPRFVFRFAAISFTALRKREFKIGVPLPILDEDKKSAGEVSSQYFLQDLYVASKIYSNMPKKHIDIGSRIDGFVAHLAVFMKVKVYDIRSISHKIKNIEFIQADVSDTESMPKNVRDSISCLHAIEHFGLGRYGDTLDYYGHIKGLNSIKKMLKKRGVLYLSFPIGYQTIHFNAHRILSLNYMLENLKEFKLLEISYIDDFGIIHENVELKAKDLNSSFGCRYGCAILTMAKI